MTVAATTPASSAALRSQRSMVVFFRHAGVNPRSVLGHEVQAEVLGRAKKLGGRVVARYAALGAATIKVTAAQAHALADDPLVRSLLPNTLVPGPTVSNIVLHSAGVSRGTPAVAPCGSHADPQLNPEALGNINATGGATSGYDGAGVTVAFLADGLSPTDPDFVRNASFASPGSPTGSHVVTYVNFSGNASTIGTGGAEAFGDAASIVAQGNSIYDLSTIVGKAHPLPANCDIRIEGDAPGASVLGINVFGDHDIAPAAVILQGINYAVTNGANVINESFGFNNFPDTSVDIIRQADEAAVADGVTVVVSSGDAGPDNTIGSPASDPSVLTVGATTTYRAYAQLTFGGINALGSHYGYLDNNISSFSSGGIAEDGKTVDLVAPGDLGWSLCSSAARFYECGGKNVQLFGGTSESSPLTAGAAADVIQAYRATHSGATPSPQLVMEILTSTAADISAPAVQQGAGLLDVGAAVQLATSAPGTTVSDPTGGVLTDTTQVDLSGLPSSVQSATIGLTNTSNSTTTVQLSTRTYSVASSESGAVTVNAQRKSPDPTFVDSAGDVNVLQKVVFEVPAGTARVQLRAAFAPVGNAAFDPINVSLFAPNGDLAAYSLPQGLADYASIEATASQSGTWTAVFFEERSTSSSGYKTVVDWSESNLVATSRGSVTPNSVTLWAGESTSVQLDVTLPSAPGDSGLSVVIAAGSQATTIPVSVRTEIPISASGGTFTGVLTGGNGRGGAPGQMNTYAFNVPPGKRDLDVEITMASNPTTKAFPTNDEVGAFLVDPYGNPQAYNVNATPDNAEPDGLKFSKTCDVYVASPQPGAWLLVLDWFQPLSGAATAIDFTGSVAFNAVTVSSNLPDSAATTVAKAGQSFHVEVQNTGKAPMELSRDARLSETVWLSANNFNGPALEPLVDAFGAYYFPNGTQAVKFQQTSTVPASFEAETGIGDPVLAPTVPEPFVTESSAPKSAMLTYSPPGGVPPGLWFMAATEIGPYPASGASSGNAILDVHVQTPAFDPAVSSKVPDVVRELFYNGFFTTPISAPLAAGAKTSIPIKITPTMATGTVVTGTLYIVDAWPGEVPQTLAAIPYEYTVGS